MTTRTRRRKRYATNGWCIAEIRNGEIAHAYTAVGGWYTYEHATRLVNDYYPPEGDTVWMVVHNTEVTAMLASAAARRALEGT